MSLNDLAIWFLNPSVSRVLFIFLASYLFLLWFALVIWVTKDIISRTNNIFLEIISILLVVILNIFGVFIYLAIRPSKTLVEKFFEDLEYEALVDSVQSKDNKTPVKSPTKKQNTKKKKSRK